MKYWKNKQHKINALRKKNRELQEKILEYNNWIIQNKKEIIRLEMLNIK